MSYLPGKAPKPKKTPNETIGLAHSSFLQAATYDPQEYSLTLEFKNGTQVVHRYVFPAVWAQFKEAKSHGSYYARSIKKQFPSVSFQQPLKVTDLKRAIKSRGQSI